MYQKDKIRSVIFDQEQGMVVGCTRPKFVGALPGVGIAWRLSIQRTRMMSHATAKTAWKREGKSLGRSLARNEFDRVKLVHLLRMCESVHPKGHDELCATKECLQQMHGSPAKTTPSTSAGNSPRSPTLEDENSSVCDVHSSEQTMTLG